jgi:pyridoxine 5-phosphate synthase
MSLATGIALGVNVDHVGCLVPEKRTELTTDGGLDAAAQQPALRDAVARLAGEGIRVSLFIDPQIRQIEAAHAVGAPVIELHTGSYADSSGAARARELDRLRLAAREASALGLAVHAGHGLDYHNVQPVAAIPEIVELNIGYAIIGRALFSGLGAAVHEMKQLMLAARA